ncbi:MAG: hypothetical protein ABIO21_07770 [Pseudomonas sp.]
MASGGRRSEDLGGMGESYFRLLAKDAQLVVNNSSDDQAGWDFEVEDSSPLAINYSNQSRPVYRIQVKATMGDSVSVPMSFSSLLSLIQYGGPAFVFFVKFGTNLMPESLRVVHIEQKQSLEILTSLRKREVKDRALKLNKSKYSLHFDSVEPLSTLSGAALRQYLESALGGSYLQYVQKKSKWLEEVESDSDLLHANIRFEGEADLQAMADCLLGYETPFNVTSAIYKAPFGIPDQEPVHSASFSSTTVWPNIDELPHGFVRLRTSAYGPVYEFKATFYSVPSSFPRKFAAVRIKTAIFDIIYRFDSQSQELRISDLFAEIFCASIVELRGFIRYMGEVVENKVTLVEIAMEDKERGSKPLRMTIETSATIPLEEYEQVSEVAERLFLRLSSLGLANELIRPVDIFDIRRTGFLAHVGSEYDPVFSFEFYCDIGAVVSEPDVTVFNFYVRLERKTLVCFAAFYGKVREVCETRLRGDFFRSEYLGEIVVPEDEDIEEAQESYTNSLKAKLRNKGLVVI